MSALPYREIIELRSVGLSFEKVAFLCGCSATKASAVSRRAAELGLGWPVPVELSDDELARLVDPRDAARCNPVDLEDIQGRAGRRLDADDVEEAYAAYVALSVDRPPYVFATFRERFVQLVKAQARGAKMLVNWHPGEEVQVDWAGRKLSLYGAGEEVTPVSLFVATLPYSDKTFVRASLEMGMQSWLEHHKAMFARTSGGAPLFVAPDNLYNEVVFDENREELDPSALPGAGRITTAPWSLPARSVRPPTRRPWKPCAHRVAQQHRRRCWSGNAVHEHLKPAQSGHCRAAEVYNDKPSWHSEAQRTRSSRRRRDAAAAAGSESSRAITWRKVGVLRRRGEGCGNYGVPRAMPTAEGRRAHRQGAPSKVYTADGRQCIAKASSAQGEDGGRDVRGAAGRAPT